MNPTNLAPGDVVYAQYALKLTGSADADLSQTVAIAAGSTLTADEVAFDAVQTATLGCDADAFDAGSAVPTSIPRGHEGRLDPAEDVRNAGRHDHALGRDRPRIRSGER
ncbi:hypothetical protein Q9R19_07560 [Microbacterium sp. ARD32]|uniref:hypothetical protein n=1 Tax=Microbacterium sp. ARD32 TaxID=2962577 RepID=UPI002881BBD1|nr:hypothetical protein [Microbacterium sp. ARD32]MDT0157474.1 hypothetical protein [Microbacterium sp. ARD32]